MWYTCRAQRKTRVCSGWCIVRTIRHWSGRGISAIHADVPLAYAATTQINAMRCTPPDSPASRLCRSWRGDAREFNRNRQQKFVSHETSPIHGSYLKRIRNDSGMIRKKTHNSFHAFNHGLSIMAFECFHPGGEWETTPRPKSSSHSDQLALCCAVSVCSPARMWAVRLIGCLDDAIKWRSNHPEWRAV